MTDVLMIGEGPPPAPARAAVGYDNVTVCTGAAGADTTSSGQGCKIHGCIPSPLVSGIPLSYSKNESSKLSESNILETSHETD